MHNALHTGVFLVAALILEIRPPVVQNFPLGPSPGLQLFCKRPVVYFEFSLRHLYYKWVRVGAKIQIRRECTHFVGRTVDPCSEASF